MIKALLIVMNFSMQAPAAEMDSTLTEEEAVSIALENSFEIKLEKYNMEIASNNNTLGNAGFLPIVDAGADYTRTIRDTEQRLLNRPDTTINGAQSTSTNAGINFNWTVFDGLKMFASKERLNQIEQSNVYILRAQIQNTISDVLKAFYNAGLEQERLRLLKSNLELSKERVQISKDKYEIGKASKLEYLQAQVDYNTDQSSYVKQQEVIAVRLYDLQRVLGLIEASDSLTLDFKYDLDLVMTREQAEDLAMAQNPDLQTMQLTREVSILATKELERARLPFLDFNMGYNYSEQESEAGFLQRNQSTGFNYGLSARMTLFDGLNQSRQIQNARLQAEYAQTSYERSKTVLKTSIRSAFLTYQNAVQLAQLETENLAVAEENVSIALERYRIGKSNPLEIREAQNNAVNAQIRHLEALNTAKIAEIELLRLTGEIVK